MIKSTIKKKKKGFTLIELIIVLAVLAIIAAIAIPNFMAVRNNSRYKADVQSCETIKRTVLMLVSDGTVPTPSADTTYAADVNSGTVEVLNGSSHNTDIESALKDINNPQGVEATYEPTTKTYSKGTANATKYYIKITTAGDVIVQTSSTFK